MCINSVLLHWMCKPEMFRFYSFLNFEKITYTSPVDIQKKKQKKGGLVMVSL